MNASDLIREDYLSFEQQTTLSKVLGQWREGTHTEALILDKGKYLGLVDKRKLIRSKLDPTHVKIGKFVKRTASLAKDTDVERIVALLSTSDTHLLPVLEDKKVVGVVYALDVLQQLKNKLTEVTAQEAGSMDLHQFQEHDELAVALKTFREKRVDRVPVMDTAGKLIGIVSVVDVLTKYMPWPISRPGSDVRRSTAGIVYRRRGRDTGEKTKMPDLPLRNVMTPLVATAAPDTLLPKLITTMHDQGISAIVLVEDGKAVGIVTTKDILEQVIRMQG